MAVPGDLPNNFRLFVTHVVGEGPFLKISGQVNKQSAIMVESLIETAQESFDKGIGAVPPAAILEGVICVAKYKDGSYYRARVTSTANLSNGLVGVHFMDYGNKDMISLSTIRFLDNFDPLLMQLCGQASDYYLARIMHPIVRWDEPLLLKLQSLLCYNEYPVTVEAQTRSIPIIGIQFNGNDLSQHLVNNKYGVPIPLAKQEVLLLQMNNESVFPPWQPSFPSESNSNLQEHVPFFTNQNFPTNPASAMRLQQNMTVPFNSGFVPAPSSISQRLLVNKVSRAPVSLKALPRQPQHVPATPIITSNPEIQRQSGTIKIGLPKVASPKKSKTYKSRLLEIKSQHKVLVSYAEEGPELFAVQLMTDGQRLQEMMDEINRQPHRSLTEPPMIGTVCLGRMSEDRIICRAVVTNLSGSQCKLFFVDFGDTEMVSYYDIFDIPEEFVTPNVFACRFCLSGVKNLKGGPQLNEAFKQLVNNKALTLKVVAPEGPPLIQYGELYLENQSVLDLLMGTMKETPQFKYNNMETLKRGSKQSVLVSYVDSCLKFFIQLSEKIDQLNAVMDAVKEHCENTSPPLNISVGAACCARFPEDRNWYRARVTEIKGNKVTVAYVDYGNEQDVEKSDLRTITPELIKLPAQAMKCTLKGYEDKPVETKSSNQLEMLALEKTLMAQVVGVMSGDTMLVTLIDESVNPSLDVARRMMQLSQPRSNHDPKSVTPVRRDALDQSFSSPEGSIPDDRKKGFRREKSFKDDRRPPREGNEDFGQRGSSFRSRDSREGFDRSGPGRHSEKYGGRQDKGDRRGGSKPWEATSPPAPLSAADDQWEESPPSTNNRQNNFKRKPKGEQQFDKPGKPDWKNKNDGGFKRPSSDNPHQKTSVQDRLKRDKFNKQDEWEEKKSDSGSYSRPERRERFDRNDRPERTDRRENNWKEKKDNWNDKKDNWNDKKDNWNDKKDNWNDKKENWKDKKDSWNNKDDNWNDKSDRKEGFKRENRGERGGRGGGRSSFSPRERAARSDRSFGSDNSASRAPRTLPRPLAPDSPYADPQVDPHAQLEVSITWIISPDSFYAQILSLQPKFLEMMHKIPQMYRGVRPLEDAVAAGASVLAMYAVDRVLYRATVLAAQPFGKYMVQYVDFGNKVLVDARDIWQLDEELIELPKMAIHCSLLGVAPVEGEWKANQAIDLCFNAPRYQCVFQQCEDGKHKVSLWSNGVSVADMLVEKGLAVSADQGASITLKDEAIDLTIIIGQQILCKVTHVESFDKISCQLDMDKAALVEKAIDSFDTTLLTPLGADSLANEVHCTVKYEGKIYRAILNDVSDPTSIKAVLPDYGRPITTKLEDLMILPNELSVYYYQALECCLNNYTEDSKKLISLDELKEKINDKKIIVYINDVDGVKVVTTLYDSVSGKKIEIFEPDDGAYDEVVPLCLRAVFNYNFGTAYVSHIETLNEVYLQKSTDSDRIAQLLDQLYKFYEEGTPEPLTTFEAETLCAAKSSDGNWYRATVVRSTDDNVTVQFTDYGNREDLARDSLRQLDAQFLEPCALGLVVGLGLHATGDALHTLRQWTDDKELQVTLSFGADGWLANLHDGGVDLGIKLVNEGLAEPQTAATAEEEPAPAADDDQPATEAPPGCISVYISHIDTPGQFWLQMADDVDRIEEIQAELRAHADGYPEEARRDVGTLCVAKYSVDEQWYRAEVLDADDDITTVRFLDYGNTDVLDTTSAGLVRELPEGLRAERLALRASVNAVPSGTGQWSEPAADRFVELAGDLAEPLSALVVLRDVTTYVDLFPGGCSITDQLVAGGHAVRAHDEPAGDLPACYASHVNSPAEFWIQLEAAVADLQTVEAELEDAAAFPALGERAEGALCAALYAEDGRWYRAQLVVDGSEGTEVLFMDYGNASIATELRELPEHLKDKPALSRKCALQKPRDIKTWSRRSEDKFNDMAAMGDSVFKVQFIASGDISIVDLYLEGKSVTEELVGLCEEPVAEGAPAEAEGAPAEAEDAAASEAPADTQTPTPIEKGQRDAGKICYARSLHQFYVHLERSGAGLRALLERLLEGGELPAAKPAPDAVLAAHWREEDQWYRARVLSLDDKGATVLFIDYGNEAHCEDFRELPDDLRALEPMARCCRLAVNEQDIDYAKRRFDKVVSENTTFQVEFLDTSEEPLLVRLTLDGDDVINPPKSEDTSENDNVEAKSAEAVAKDDTNKEQESGMTTEKEIDSTQQPDAVPATEESTDEEKVDDVDLDTTPNELNESLDSAKTVIENKSFEGDLENGDKDAPDDGFKSESQTKSLEKDSSADTLENSSESVKSPEGDESKESINTDTDYTSSQETEKSPEKDKSSGDK